MTQGLAGPGLSLPYPSTLYPSSLAGVPTLNTNYFQLAAGTSQLIPAGRFLVQVGPYSFLQFKDPVTGLWRNYHSQRTGPHIVVSDGVNYRVANQTGCPIAAVVTNPGSGTYVQSTTTVVPSTGNSTWQPIIGGLLTLNTISAAGANYAKPPVILLPVPGNPGVQATAIGAISSGTVSTITVTNQGAGYPGSATTGKITVSLLPDPTDPNFGSVTLGTAIFAPTGAGLVAAVLCTDPGAVTSAAPTLTIAGAGSGALATAVWLNTITARTITANGAGYGADNIVTTSGGVTAATPTWTNPGIELTAWIPRAAQMLASVAGTLGTVTSISTIYDSGLFTGTPRVIVLGGVVTTVSSITPGLGSTPDSYFLQQL